MFIKEKKLYEELENTITLYFAKRGEIVEDSKIDKLTNYVYIKIVGYTSIKSKVGSKIYR